MCVSTKDEQNKTWSSSKEFSKCEARSRTQAGGDAGEGFWDAAVSGTPGSGTAPWGTRCCSSWGWEVGNRAQGQAGDVVTATLSWERNCLALPSPTQMFYDIWENIAGKKMFYVAQTVFNAFNFMHSISCSQFHAGRSMTLASLKNRVVSPLKHFFPTTFFFIRRKALYSMKGTGAC